MGTHGHGLIIVSLYRLLCC